MGLFCVVDHLVSGREPERAENLCSLKFSEQSYYRWRKEYGGLGVDQAKRLKQLETENVRPKKLVADLSLEKQVLQDIAQGNW